MGSGDVCTMPRSLCAGQRQRNWVVEEVQIVDCLGLVADLTFGAVVVLGLFTSEARVVLEGLINAFPLLSNPSLRHCGRAIQFSVCAQHLYNLQFLIVTGIAEL